jgi:Na+-driven multidrug efflux pump
VLRLALPVLVEQFLAMSVGFSARTLAGHYLETTHLAAITLVAYLVWLLYEMFSVVGIGATAMVARFVGAGDFRGARLVTTQALLLGSLLSCVVLTLTALFGEQMVGWLEGFQLWFLSVINQLGPLATAAHGVALSIESLALLPGVVGSGSASEREGQGAG